MKLYIVYEKDYICCFIRVAKDDECLKLIAKEEYGIDFEKSESHWFEELNIVDGYNIKLEEV